MATLLENETVQRSRVSREAELHNAGISERYRRLRDAVEKQFEERTIEQASTTRASTLAPERPVFTAPIVRDVPVVEQAPTVTEYVRDYVDSPVFTTDKFQTVENTYAPTPVEMPAVTTVAATTQEEQYSLSRGAKMVMAAFAAVVTSLLTAICVNTHIINQKTAQIEMLETRKAELIEESAELQARLENAKSEETIRNYAQEQGMIQINR